MNKIVKNLICILIATVLIVMSFSGCRNTPEIQSSVSEEDFIEEVVIQDDTVQSNNVSSNIVNETKNENTPTTESETVNSSQNTKLEQNISSKQEVSSKQQTSSKQETSSKQQTSSKQESPSKPDTEQNVSSITSIPTKCMHQYSEKIEEEAVLFKMGTKSFTCSKCGDSYTKDYPIESIKLLSISNSYGKNALWELYDICKAEGVKNVDIAVMYIAGCSLDQHWENIQNNNAIYEVFRNNNGKWTSTPNCTIDSLLAEGDWDVITTQNSSGLSGRTDGYKNLNNVADYIKGKCPNSKLIWHLIWGYQNGSKWLTPNSYNGDEKFMYESIVNCTNDIVISSGKFDSVAPVGAAIMNARTSKLKNIVHLDDGSHLSEEFGYYIAAFTWYCHLTGQDVYDTNFAVNGMISSEELNITVESAKNALKNPYKITQSYYTR